MYVPGCLNCGENLHGDYCTKCGQKAGPTRLTFREFMQETTQELTHWDGKVPKTLITLVARPGQLTVDLLAGRRARWLSPLRVYLICSIAFFAVRPITEAVTGNVPRKNVRLTGEGIEPGKPFPPEVRQAIAEGLPGRLFGVDRIERAHMSGRAIDRQLYAVFPNAMFVLLPFLALLTNIMWRRRIPEYPAHLYVALHFLAGVFAAFVVYWILATALARTELGGVAFVLLLANIAWFGVATFRRVFRESLVKTIAKTVVVGLVFWLACMAMTVGILASLVLDA